MAQVKGTPRYWLFKTEPESYSFAMLMAEPKRRTGWDGVRNYQARNFLRDQVQVGDGVLVYHSGTQTPGIVGIARVVRAGYADETAFDPGHEHYDPKSKPEAPTWFQVEIEGERVLPRVLALDGLRQNPALAGLALLQKGQRLSIQPVRSEHWDEILRCAKLHS